MGLAMGEYLIDGEPPTSAMVALIPCDADLARLAVEGGEPPEAMHLTLSFLGDAPGWDAADRATTATMVAATAASMGPITGEAFAAALFNPGPEQAHVLLVGEGKGYETGASQITQCHDAVAALFDGADIPAQHSPWVAHLTLGYGESVGFADAIERTGPIMFDRLRLAFGGEIADMHLSGPMEDPGSEMAMAPTMMPCPPEDASTPAGASTAGGVALSGPVAFENQMTGDGRIFAPGAIGWLADSFPWPFRWAPADNGGHDGAVVIGRVDGLSRDPSSPGAIFANVTVFTGDSAPPEAAAYLNLLANGAAGGVSVDGDMAEFTVVDKLDANGDFVGMEMHFTQMRLRTMTAVDIPAFAGAKITLADTPSDCPDDMPMMAIIASAIPVEPPLEWFETRLAEPTPVTVTADGQVFGHLALKGTCHIAQPQGCVTPPTGSTYAYFHTGEVLCAGGEAVAVGHLTFGTGHAAMSDNALAAASHYDNTGTVAADVRAGEDEYGIWVAGALRSTLTDEQIREFRAAPLSGDWRRIGGRLELVAALAVNTPGFPVPRTRARVLVASGHQQSVIAAAPSGDITFDGDEERSGTKARLANTLRKSELRHRLVRK
jgi:2'-5' RNA ligase